MFFVVFLLEPEVNIVIPKSWILDIDKHWEKFVNNFRINSSQRFLCFWSEEAYAQVNGEPNPNFQPNFNNNLNHRFPAEGCYYGKLVNFNSKCINEIK